MRIFPSNSSSVEESWPELKDLRGDMDWIDLLEYFKTLTRKPSKNKAEVESRCRAINSNLQAKQPLWVLLVKIKSAHQKIENLEHALKDFEELGEKAKEKASEKVRHRAIPFAQLPEYNSICLFRREKPLIDDTDVDYLRTSIIEKTFLHSRELDTLRKRFLEFISPGPKAEVPATMQHSPDFIWLLYFTHA